MMHPPSLPIITGRRLRDLFGREARRLYTLNRKEIWRNLQLRLGDGDLPLEGRFRLAFGVRLHVWLACVAIVERPVS